MSKITKLSNQESSTKLGIKDSIKLGSDEGIQDDLKLGSDDGSKLGIKHGILLGSDDSNKQLQ
eukprot:3893972-Ditylum_brightwellii.AAC.1